MGTRSPAGDPESRCPNATPFDHTFGQDTRRPQETRMLAITGLTLGVMVIEVAAGWLTGSMALLTDGVHMGTHALALGLALAAYMFGRRHAHDRSFSFGTGKAGELAGFASALILVLSAFALVGESVSRLLTPQPIAYLEALLVAIVGLIVNVVSAIGLTGGHDHHHPHANDHGSADHHRPGHAHDNNLRAALVHVITDAITSLGAIVALLAAWQFGWAWLDPAVAILAAVVILIWGYGLLRDTGRVLLDMEAPDERRESVRAKLESDGTSIVTDLHIWSIGPGVWTLVASITAHANRTPDDYKALLADDPHIHHPIIEIRPCVDCAWAR